MPELGLDELAFVEEPLMALGELGFDIHDRRVHLVL